VRFYVTVNYDSEGKAREMFGKCNTADFQGWLDVLCETGSLYLQRDGTMQELMRHWRGHRFEPSGVLKEGSSIVDAIARHFMDDENNGAALPPSAAAPPPPLPLRDG